MLSILFLGFTLRVPGLSAQGLYAEEGYSTVLAQDSIGRILAQTASLDSNTPLHYLLLSGWIRAAGSSEFSVRALSVFAGVVTIALAYQLMKACGLPAGARRCAAALVAAWPVCISFSQEARMYALLMCLTTLSTWLLIRGLHNGGRGTWLLWSAAHIATFATHVFGALIFGAQLCVVVAWWATQRENGRWRHAAIALALTALVLGVWMAIILSVSVPASTTYAGGLDLLQLMTQGLAANVMPRLASGEEILAVAILALMAMLFILLSRRLRLLSLLALIGIVAICAFSAWTGKFSWRYPTLVAPLVAAGLGAAVWQSIRSAAHTPAGRLVAGVVVFIACILGSVAFLAWRNDPANANEDYRGVAAYLRQHARSDEPIVMIPNLSHIFGYYYGAGDWHWLPPAEMINLQDTLDFESVVPWLNQWLSGRQGAWLLLYDETLLDPSHIAQTLLRRQSVALTHDADVQQFHNLRLLHYTFFQPYQPLPEQLPAMESTIEPTDRQRGLTGLGCHQFQAARAGDAWMEIFCFWQTKPYVQLPYDTKVSFRLTDSAGKQVLQSDQMIALEGMPYLPFEKPITGVYVIPLPGDLPAGEYVLHAIPYTPDEEISPRVSTEVKLLTP